MDEPVVVVWIIKSDGTATCEPADICPIPSKRTNEMIGYQCASPTMSAQINSHHEVLHRELNDCKNPK